jgi:D-xylose transport system substrate-binding protein
VVQTSTKAIGDGIGERAGERLGGRNGSAGPAELTPGGQKRLFLVFASLLLSVLLGLALGRRGGGGGGGPIGGGARGHAPVVIGLSFDTLKEERWQRDRAVFIARARALGASVIDLSANSNDTQQMQDVESLLTSQVSVLVIVAHNGAAMAKAVGLAHAAGIPVIAYDRLIPDCDLDFYITFDAVKVGAVQAQYLIDHLPTPGHGRIVRMHGAKTDHNAHLVKEGQDKVLAPYLARGDLVVTHEDWVDEWKPEHAKRIVNAALLRSGAAQAGAAAPPQIDGILAPNDGTAGGAAQALSEEGLSGKVVLTGQDAELAACQRIYAGTQTMTVYKPLGKLASRAAEIAVAMASGRPVVARAEIDNGKVAVPAIFIDVVPVDKATLLDTVAADGFHSADAIRGR